MVDKGRFYFDKRPARKNELTRLIELSMFYKPFMADIFIGLKDKREKPFSNIIDVGAGTGHTTYQIKALFPNAAVTWLDSSVELLEYAWQSSPDEAVGIEFVNCGLMEYEPTREYDFVFSRFALKHFYDPKLAVSKMVEMLSDGGYICLIDKDVTANVWHPGFPLYQTRFMKALNAYNRKDNRGGDSSIGRKLKTMLAFHGIRDINVNLLVIDLTSPRNKAFQKLYIQVYSNLVPELVEEKLISEEEAMADIERMEKFLSSANNFALTFDFIVTGIR